MAAAAPSPAPSGALPRSTPVAVMAVDARRAADVAVVAGLFEAYRGVLVAHDVPIDTFQGFGAEIAALPGPYAEPRGVMLVAVEPDDAVGSSDGCVGADGGGPAAGGIRRWDGSGAALGCVALKPLAATDGTATCEVKRLYVRPDCRGRGAARALSATVLEYAAAAGYDRVVLDTLHRLEGALPLYTSLGFTPCPAYCYNPMPDVVFMERWLRRPAVATASAPGPTGPAPAAAGGTVTVSEDGSGAAASAALR